MQEIREVPHFGFHDLPVLPRDGEYGQCVGRIAGHVAHQFAELSHGGFGVDERNLDVVGLTAQRMGHDRAICSLLLSPRQLVHVHIGGRDEQCAGTHRFDIIRDGSDRHFSRRRRIKIETVSAGKQP